MSSKIIDSSVYISLFILEDSQHTEALKIFVSLGDTKIFLPYHVFSEVLTVLTYKGGRDLSEKFYNTMMNDDRFILISSDITEEIFFWQNHKVKMSFIDSCIIHTALKYSVDLISFDKQMISLYKQYSV